MSGHWYEDTRLVVYPTVGVLTLVAAGISFYWRRQAERVLGVFLSKFIYQFCLAMSVYSFFSLYLHVTKGR